MMKYTFKTFGVKHLFVFAFLFIILNSCSYTIYKVNWHELKIQKKETYLVSYHAEIPIGVQAKISYTDSDMKVHQLYHVTGKWIKVVSLATGQPCVFKVIVKRPKPEMPKTVTTSLTVNGEPITRQTQSGRNILFDMDFRLP